MDNPKSSTKKILGIGILAAVTASLCCITPVLALIAGIGGIASAFSWLEPVRPFLIGITAFVIGLAWYQKLKPGTKQEIACECDEDKTSFWKTNTSLSIVTIIAALLIAFPYFAKIFYPDNQQTQVIAGNKDNIETVELKIKGMYCEGCGTHVNYEISKVKGVIECTTSYEKGISIVKYDKSQTNIESIIAAVNATGYKVVSYKVISYETQKPD
jgi:mercuric ion transport protein